MASSGIVKTNTVYDSYFWVKWELASQDIAGNKSTISWSCGITPGHKFYSNAVKMSAVTINGSQVYAGGTYSNITDYKERTLASGTLTIAHDSDGSKTFTVAAFSGQVWKTNSYLTATAAAQSFALPTIPRATVPVIGAVVMGQTVTIGLPRAVSSFTHTLTYVFGSASGTIAEGAGTEAQWAVPYDLAAQIPNSASGTGTLTCKTYSGSTLIGTQAVTFTATVPSNSTTQPSDTLAVSPVSSLAAPFNGLYIQGRTKAKITHTASGKYGATIKSYAATLDGQTYTGQAPTTDILATPGTLTITGTATDSRGITGTATTSITVLAYTPPSVERNTSTDALICARALADGTLDDDGTALYVACSRKYSGLGGNNAASVQVRYKAESGEWSDWVTFFAEDASGDNYAGVIAGITLAIESPYTIDLRAVDKLGESGGTLSFAVPTSEATVDLGEGGNSLGVGRRAHVGTEKRLDVAWDSNFEKNVRVDGDLFVGDLTSLKAALVDIFHPVGAYYSSSDPTSPEELFGGTWEEIHGRFLFAEDDAHPAGSTGGEEAHTLTVGEMPSHGNHLMQGRMYEELAENASNDSSYRSNTLYLPKTAFASTGNFNRGWKDWNGGEMYPAGTLKGGGNPHNNMPPYLATYTWHRIA
nr:MAG TPA: baseplate protein [Caudoviricetes sp.]